MGRPSQSKSKPARTKSNADEAWVPYEDDGLEWDLENAVRPRIASDQPFELVTEFEPRGSQPEAIAKLVRGL
jgi:excinuclease ABC subunit B